MICAWLRIVIAICIMSISPYSLASEICDISDFKNTTDYKNQYQIFMSLVFTTNENNFSSRQKDLEFGGALLFANVPLKVFGSFSSIDTWRNEKKQKLDYQSSGSESTSYYTTNLSSEGMVAYRDCISKTQPLSITAISQNNDVVTFVVDWKPPPLVGVNTFNLQHTSAINELDINDINGFTYVPQNEKFLTYKLKANKPFNMVIESEPKGYSATIDYMLVRYKACTIAENGLESITTETVLGYVANAGKKDRARDAAWINAQTKLKKGEHRELKIISEVYDPSKEKPHPKSGMFGDTVYNRAHYFTVSYNPIYFKKEHMFCGLAFSSE